MTKLNKTHDETEGLAGWKELSSYLYKTTICNLVSKLVCPCLSCCYCRRCCGHSSSCCPTTPSNDIHHQMIVEMVFIALSHPTPISSVPVAYLVFDLVVPASTPPCLPRVLYPVRLGTLHTLRLVEMVLSGRLARLVASSRPAHWKKLGKGDNRQWENQPGLEEKAREISYQL